MALKRKFNGRKRKSFKKVRKMVSWSKHSSSRKFNKKKARKFSLSGKAVKAGTSHWLSIGAPGFDKAHKPSSWMNKYLKMNATNTYTFSQSGQLSIAPASSTQNVFTVTGIYTPYDLSLFIPSIGIDNHIILKSVSCVMTMMNQSDMPAFVELYDIQARKTLLGTAGTSYQDPASAWINEVATSNAKVYGGTPFGATSFTENYKVNRITRLNLAAGETAEHILNIKNNHVFKDSDLIPAAPVQDKGSFEMFTRFIMAVVRSPPTDDSISPLVGSGSVKVDFVCAKEYRTCQVVLPAGAHTVGTVITQITAPHVMETDGDNVAQIFA